MKTGSENEKGWKRPSSKSQPIKRSQRHIPGCAVLVYQKYRRCCDVSADGYVDIGEKTQVGADKFADSLRGNEAF